MFRPRFERHTTYPAASDVSWRVALFDEAELHHMPYRWSARLRRNYVKGRLVLRRFARTRSARAATQFVKALRADVSDLPVLSRAKRCLIFLRLTGKGERVAWASIAQLQSAEVATLCSRAKFAANPCRSTRLDIHDLPFGDVVEGGAERAILLEASSGQSLVRKGPFKAPDKALNELPPHLIKAVISIEDKRFFSHDGIDLQAMLRALGSNMKAGAIVQGGSTISQQLVRVLYLDRQPTLMRKFREAALALWLEANLSKHEILTRYLNNVYLGAGATGMPAAALTYFGKDASDLTLAESALLAGLIVAPSYLNPRHNLDGARARAALVLDAMVANGRLDPAMAKAAKNHPARLAPKPAGLQAGTWFTDWVYGEAVEIAGSFQGTMRVRTTLVPALQALAEKVVSKALARQGKANDVDPSRAASDAAERGRRRDGRRPRLPEERV